MSGTQGTQASSPVALVTGGSSGLGAAIGAGLGAILATNFHGAADTIRAFLPSMRERRRGTILPPSA